MLVHTLCLSIRCEGKQACSVPVINSVFSNPCVGTHKYLDVSYHCLPYSKSRARHKPLLNYLHICRQYHLVSCFINTKMDFVKGFLFSYKFRENSSLWKAGRWNKMWYVFIILILPLFKISNTSCCLGGGGGVIYNAFCTQDSGLIFIHHANYGRRDPLTCASILANTSNCFYPQTSNSRSR